MFGLDSPCRQRKQMRTTAMQLTVAGLGGLSEERLRYEVETFLLPAIIEE